MSYQKINASNSTLLHQPEEVNLGYILYLFIRTLSNYTVFSLYENI